LIRLAEERLDVNGNSLNTVKQSNFMIRLKSWEYWPFGIIQLPFFFYWLWLSLKARSLLFFSASNPGILTGGMFGESKFDILMKIPHDKVARSGLIVPPATREDVIQKMNDMRLEFPVIFKPDLGERGWMVQRIDSAADIDRYLQSVRTNFIVQELIDLPLEFGVFYRRFPSDSRGVVTSIVIKEMLAIEGDGQTSFKELILRKERAKLQWKNLQVVFHDRLDSVPAPGEQIELESIGNHCRGTKFLDGSDLITEKLSESFDALSRQIPGFYFGRYDLRTASVTDLTEGNVKIMELNGCGAEPAHIYDPRHSLLRAMNVMRHHWGDMYRISIENHLRGIPFMTFREGIRTYRNFRATINHQ